MMKQSFRFAKRRRILSCSLAMVCGSLLIAFGEREGDAQVIQLPVIRVFRINSAVKVPDGGFMHLGGTARSASGSTTGGVPGLSNIPGANRLFKNRAIGREHSAANAGVTARIISLEELEQQVLAEGERRLKRDAEQERIERKARFIEKHVGRRKR